MTRRVQSPSRPAIDEWEILERGIRKVLMHDIGGRVFDPVHGLMLFHAGINLISFLEYPAAKQCTFPLFKAVTTPRTSKIQG